MKKSKLILLPLLLLLVGCDSNNDVIKHNTGSDPSNSNNFTENSDDVLNSLDRGITTNELVDVIDKVNNETIVNAKSLTISKKHIVTKDNETKNYSLSYVKKSFDNSVVVSSILDADKEDYEYFNDYDYVIDNALGVRQKSYTYLSEGFNDIVTTYEFVNLDTNVRTIKEVKSPYSLKAYDENFIIANKGIITATLDQISVAGYIDETLFIRSKRSEKSDLNKYEKSITTDYYIKDDKLLTIYEYSKCGDEELLLETFEKKELSYLSNGSYNKNIIPTAQ